MGDEWFRAIAAREPRLAPYATGPLPAWLWSGDGERILWCNAAAAAALGISDVRELERPRSPADSHRRQVSQLAGRLSRDGATRLERLRGFGARLGQLRTCACARLDLTTGEDAILVVAMEAASRRPSAAAGALPANRDPGRSAASEPARVEMVADIPPATMIDPAPGNRAVAGEPDEVSSDDGAATAIAPEPTVDRGQEPMGHTPLRFIWQIDAAGGFSVRTDGFLRIADERTASLSGRTWIETAEALDLDSRGYVARAIANRETFSSIAVAWPLAGSDERASVDLSGMPIYDGARNFAGYRGFGICRQGGSRVAAEPVSPAPTARAERPDALPSHDSDTTAESPAVTDSPSPAETETVEPPKNVVPFPLTNDARTPSLSAIENHAFDEIARRLTQQAADDAGQLPRGDKHDLPQEAAEHEALRDEQPAWLAATATPARGDSARERMLLDLMPSGILIYRLDRLLYANRAFLAASGFDSLAALQEAGGLDALYVEYGSSAASSASTDGMPLKIAPPSGDATPSDARLYSILWDGDAAHALILQGPQARTATATPTAATAPVQRPDVPLETLLESISDGVVLFDRAGEIVSCNHSAETLFGVGASELHRFNFADLFTDASQRIVLDSFEELDRSGAASLRGAAQVFARARTGLVPLTMTMGRNSDRDRFFAVFRGVPSSQPADPGPVSAARAGERAAPARVEELAGLSHEIRGPLNTIAGSAGVMIDERFGALGNERYVAYLKDIRASAERALAILDGITDISNIESGRHELTLVGQNLNEMVEQCVGVLQPQANRERVIIRTSLAHALPQVIADTQALRQITMNIVTSSIRASKGGGQVIVSTAPGDNGGAVLRVRDSGRSAADAAASDHAAAPLPRAGERGAIDLSLARALAEANRARFEVRTTENSGTLIEVAFSNVRALAG